MSSEEPLMPVVHTEIEIGAWQESVWQALTDFESYPKWNHSILRLRGRPEQHARLELHVRLFAGLGFTVRPTVLRLEPNRELCWRGWLWTPHWLEGEHSFRIEPLASNRVRFIQREVFRGLLALLLRPWLETALRASYARANEALKARLEQQTLAIVRQGSFSRR